jgi:hypothetical protein
VQRSCAGGDPLPTNIAVTYQLVQGRNDNIENLAEQGDQENKREQDWVILVLHHRHFHDYTIKWKVILRTN